MVRIIQMPYVFPVIESSISQFRTDKHKETFSVFANYAKKHSVPDIVLLHVESYLMYDEKVHTIEYALTKNLPHVLNFLVAMHSRERAYYAYDLLFDYAKNETVDMFKALYENTTFFNMVLEHYDYYDWELDWPQRPNIVNYNLVCATLRHGNIGVFSYLVDEKKVDTVRDSEWDAYYSGEDVEWESIAIANGQFELCVYLIKRGGDATTFYSYATLHNVVPQIEALDSNIFDSVPFHEKERIRQILR